MMELFRKLLFNYFRNKAPAKFFNMVLNTFKKQLPSISYDNFYQIVPCSKSKIGIWRPV